MTHALKILPQYFGQVALGNKNFELRKDDRKYQVGDALLLREFDGEQYTGRSLLREITYIYCGNGEYGLSEGYCILGMKAISEL